MAPPTKDAGSKKGSAKDAVVKESEDEAKVKEVPAKPIDPVTACLNGTKSCDLSIIFPYLTLDTELKNCMQTLDKAVSSKEVRFMSRLIRQVTTLRRLLVKPALLQAIEIYVSAESPVR